MRGVDIRNSTSPLHADRIFVVSERTRRIQNNSSKKQERTVLSDKISYASNNEKHHWTTPMKATEHDPLTLCNVYELRFGTWFLVLVRVELLGQTLICRPYIFIGS